MTSLDGSSSLKKNYVQIHKKVFRRKVVSLKVLKIAIHQKSKSSHPTYNLCSSHNHIIFRAWNYKINPDNSENITYNK